MLYKKMSLKFPLAALFLFSSISIPAFSLNITVLSDQLKSPWAVAIEPSGEQILITEKKGRLLRFSMNDKQLKVIATIPTVKVLGQGGLMDIALAPDFESSAKLFFTYAKARNNGAATTLASAKLQKNTDGWTLTNWRDLLITQPSSNSGRHFGSRIAFDNNNHVYFSVGDRGERASAQNLSSHTGSILRLNLDGSIPWDNPFINNAQHLPEIYSYGHRNPQGLTFIKNSNQLLAVEHGPRGGDEINLILAGNNYGWPVISYGKEYWGPVSIGKGTAQKGLQQPLMQYTPSIAPSSLIYYQDNYFPKLQHSFLLGALALRHLSQVRFKQPIQALVTAKQQPHQITQWLKNYGRRIRDIATLKDGRIIAISDRGELILIEK